MPKNVPSTAIALVLSNEDIASRMQALLQSDPALATALAMRSLAPKAVRGTRSVPAQESELDRMLRCAHFVQASERRTILSDLFSRLGDKDKIVCTEKELAESTGYRSPVLRRSLDIVSQRLNDYDTSYVAKYPEVLEIGYTILVEGDRAHARTVTFARAVKAKAVTVRKARKTFKGKAVTYTDAIAETAKEESKG